MISRCKHFLMFALLVGLISCDGDSAVLRAGGTVKLSDRVRVAMDEKCGSIFFIKADSSAPISCKSVRDGRIHQQGVQRISRDLIVGESKSPSSARRSYFVLDLRFGSITELPSLKELAAAVALIDPQARIPAMDKWTFKSLFEAYD